MLEVTKLVVSYGPLRALHGVSLTVGAGEIVAVTGTNGAGKTTLLHAICGLVRPSAGQVVWQGEDVTGRPFHRIDGMALVPEGRVLAPTLTVAETLRLGAGRVRPRILAERREGVFEVFPELRQRLAQRAGTLSGGEAQMLAFARALMSAPRLLLLDEPALGLSPAAARRVFDTIPRLREADISILLVDQDVGAALRVADRGLVLKDGQIAAAGMASELRGEPALSATILPFRIQETDR